MCALCTLICPILGEYVTLGVFGPFAFVRLLLQGFAQKPPEDTCK